MGRGAGLDTACSGPQERCRNGTAWILGSRSASLRLPQDDERRGVARHDRGDTGRGALSLPLRERKRFQHLSRSKAEAKC